MKKFLFIFKNEVLPVLTALLLIILILSGIKHCNVNELPPPIDKMYYHLYRGAGL